MTTVRIAVEQRPYEALIESGLLPRVGTLLKEQLAEASKFFIITTPPVRKHWGEPLGESFTAAALEHHGMEMPDGEMGKTLSVVEQLANKLAKRGADRTAVIVALGGGAVGDVTGLLASVFMRGVDIVQVPTTLLAQVDASIGGKTAVNLRAGKNLLGTFHQPRAVFIDPAVLATLPEREFRAGLYEALKYGVVRNPEIFQFMEQQRDAIVKREPAALEWLITECVKVKAEVVAADERESGPRRILNFGHTVGHALEAETDYKHFLHGEAVGWGMIAAAMIGVAQHKTDPATAQRIISAALAYASLPRVTARGKNVVKRLLTDKKTMNGVPHFVLPVELGRVEIVNDVPERAVVQAVEELRYLSQV